MRRSVVITLFGTIACNKAATELPTTNPPPAPSPRVLNGVHPEHGRVFRNPDGTCRVNLPFPREEGPPVSFRPPPTQVVDCPVHMADPSWSECYGTATTGPEPGQCLCAVIGNPPPPPRVVPCPKAEL